MKHLPILLILLFPSVGLGTEGDERFCSTVNLYLENDLFGETDQHYTNGIRFSCVSQDLSSYLKDPDLPDWVREANHRLRFFHNLKDAEALQRNLVISTGQLIFTPGEKDTSTLIEDGRPYAGYLYLGFAYHIRDREQLDTLELNVGMVGPASLAENAQDLIHEIRGIDKFQGWDHQLENELGLQFVYEHKRRYKLTEQWPHQDAILHAGGSLGNVATYLNFGAEYRVGWQLSEDFGTAALRPGGGTTVPRGGAIYATAVCPSVVCTPLFPLMPAWWQGIFFSTAIPLRTATVLIADQ